MNIVETNLDYRSGMRPVRSVDFLIIHHTASTRDLTPEEIHEEHLNLDWLGFGYHYYIRKDGTIYRGRPEDFAGSHCEGYNIYSLGICLSGNFEIEEPRLEQLNSLKGLLKELRFRYPKAVVKSHSFFNATACCGKNLRSQLDDIAKTDERNFVKVFTRGGKITLVFSNNTSLSKMFFDEKELLRNLHGGIKFEV